MISEVLNALFLTFLVTEYLLASNNNIDVRGRADWTKRLWTKTNVCAATVVAVINVLERVTGASDLARHALQGFWHAPKILLVAVGYVLALRWDCRRSLGGAASASGLPWPRFLLKVGVAFCYVLPVYPALAVLISFGFLVVINLFEMLHLNEDLLNWPIYYGTLYGPFSLVYWKVKGDVLEERTSLPSTSASAGRRLGGRD